MLSEGHVVRGTTRQPDGVALLDAAGVEPFVGDPDRIGTLVPALEHTSLVCLLLGSVVGEPEQIEALHSTRLEMLLHKLLDTTARGIVYEATGTVDAGVLERGAALVRTAAETSRIPYALIEADPVEPVAWLDAAADAVSSALS
jgi:hypothetical protein